MNTCHQYNKDTKVECLKEVSFSDHSFIKLCVTLRLNVYIAIYKKV